MLKALDVANFFVTLSIRAEENDITNLKLNKLVYFAQGLHLAQFDTALFPEPVEAWKFGPVVASVYSAFNPYGGNIITKETGTFSQDRFTAEEIEFLLDIDAEYGKYAANKLVDMTHEPGGPWASCYREGALHTIIPQESMKAYFADKLISKPSVDPAKIPRAGYRGKDGVLVLPAEDYCKEDDIYNTYPGKNE